MSSNASHPAAWAALAPLGAVAIWSGNTIVTKSAASVIDPASITLYRWTIAFLLLAPFVAGEVWRKRVLVRRLAPKLAVLGTLGMVTYQGLAYVAAQTASAVDMGVILALMPLMSALLANAFAEERLSLLRLAGVLVSFGGLIVMTTHGNPAMLLETGGSGLGDLLMLVAVFANSLYGVLLKRWAIPLSTWQQMWVQMAVAIVVTLPFWLAGPMIAMSAANAPLVLYAALPASLGAPFCWIMAVKTLGASRASLFMNLLPPCIALLAWLFLGEQLHWYHAVGGALALLGVAVALRKTPSAKAELQKA